MSRDLFDESTMSFGEHLEVLRVHLWKALIGVALGVAVSLIFSKPIIDMIRRPIDRALAVYDVPVEDIPKQSLWETVSSYFGFGEAEEQDPPAKTDAPAESPVLQTIEAKIDAVELLNALHKVQPDQFALPAATVEPQTITLSLQTDALPGTIIKDEQLKPITIEIQEAFMTYMKVAIISGLIFSSPWVFYQIWQFVAAGLYPHERKYVYRFAPMSLGLFLVGVVFCFLAVIPIVLEFLLGFNLWLGLTPQIRMSSWISFAVTLPLMFGISFQLPLVMLFLERISIFTADGYREKRRISILVIAVLSMLLTPSDPTSMIMMMLPLMALYEVGILLCGTTSQADPFEAQPT